MSDPKSSREENATTDTKEQLGHDMTVSKDSDLSSVVSADAALSDLQPPYEIHVLKSLRRIIRALDLYSRKLKNSYGLTVPQLVCLTAIAKEGPLSSI